MPDSANDNLRGPSPEAWRDLAREINAILGQVQELHRRVLQGAVQATLSREERVQVQAQNTLYSERGRQGLCSFCGEAADVEPFEAAKDSSPGPTASSSQPGSAPSPSPKDRDTADHGLGAGEAR